MIVWINQKLVPEALATIHVADRGFTLGDGLFETLVAKNQIPLYLQEHLDRLRSGCSVINLPYPSIDVTGAIQETLVANQLTEAIVRLTLSRGRAGRGLVPPVETLSTLVITATPLEVSCEPAHCWIAEKTRRNEYSPLTRIKALPYLDNILALQEAIQRGGNEAILLNTAGRVAASSRANLFVVKEGHIITPPVLQGALPGTIRSMLMKKWPIYEQKIRPHELFQADEIFLTNSLALRSVMTVNGKPIGLSNHYPMTQKMRDLLA